MSYFVLRTTDKNENDATRRVYLWKGGSAAGCFCLHVAFYRTRKQAELMAAKVNSNWSGIQFQVCKAFND